jgi:hypothetical protein
VDIGLTLEFPETYAVPMLCCERGFD